MVDVRLLLLNSSTLKKFTVCQKTPNKTTTSDTSKMLSTKYVQAYFYCMHKKDFELNNLQ